MSTRTVAGKLEALVEQASELEDLGSKIQIDDEVSALKTAAQLDRSYREWFASALTLLPDDLKERFRFEYEGDVFRNRIKRFLGQPREASLFYASLDKEAVKALAISPWQYPFNDAFEDHLLLRSNSSWRHTHDMAPARTC